MSLPSINQRNRHVNQSVHSSSANTLTHTHTHPRTHINVTEIYSLVLCARVCKVFFFVCVESARYRHLKKEKKINVKIAQNFVHSFVLEIICLHRCACVYMSPKVRRAFVLCTFRVVCSRSIRTFRA